MRGLNKSTKVTVLVQCLEQGRQNTIANTGLPSLALLFELPSNYSPFFPNTVSHLGSLYLLYKAGFAAFLCPLEIGPYSQPPSQVVSRSVFIQITLLFSIIPYVTASFIL